MFDKLFVIIFKYSRAIFWVALLIFGAGSCYLIFKWTKPANSFGDNIMVEFFVGGLFLIVPILIGIYVGTKQKELQFYNRIRHLLSTIKRHRKNGDIKPEATRNIVVEFSSSLGDEILEEDWLKKAIRTDWKVEEAECGVCGLNADTVNDKCKHCKLDCFAWKE